jgi:hypothetical protein
MYNTITLNKLILEILAFNFLEIGTLIWVKKVKVKIKVTPLQALRLCTGRTAHRGNTSKALPFLDHGTRRG